MYLLGNSPAYILGSDVYEYAGPATGDSTPDAFSFAAVSSANPGAVVTAIASITGVDSGAALVATNFELSNTNGSSWSNSVVYVPGQTLVRATVLSNSTFGGTATQTGSVNGVSATFTVTTRAAVTTPAAFSFNAVPSAEPGATVTATSAITGVDAGVTLTAVNLQLSNNGGSSWSSSVTYVPGATLVRASVTASASSGGVATQTGSVNGVSATFTVTTRVISTTPSAYSFVPVVGVNPGAVVSATAPISGVDPGATLTAVEFELSNDSGETWASSVAFVFGRTMVKATVTANAASEGVATQTGSVNGVGAVFSVTTRAIDSTPNAFSFTPAVDAVPGAEVTAVAPISGVEPGVTLAAIDLELSNDGGSTWGTSVAYVPGLTLVRASVTASEDEGGVESKTGSVNGVSSTFMVTTLTYDTIPNQFAFSTVFSAVPGATVRSVRAISGVTPGTTLTAVNFELSNDNRQTWSNEATYVPGQTFVRATVTASETPGEYASQSGSVNDVEATFNVRTRTEDSGGSGFSGGASMISSLTSGF